MLMNREIRQVSSYDFHFGLENYTKEFWKYIVKNKELRGWTNIYYLEAWDALKSNCIRDGGWMLGTLQEYLDEISQQRYVVLGNLANGGDPNIDIICSHYIVYFTDDFDYFRPDGNVEHISNAYAILIDDETVLG
jgi:hypothetical protein